jgi:hypothetical protein
MSLIIAMEKEPAILSDYRKVLASQKSLLRTFRLYRLANRLRETNEEHKGAKKKSKACCAGLATITGFAVVVFTVGAFFWFNISIKEVR